MRDLKIIDVKKVKNDKRSFGSVYQLYKIDDKHYKIRPVNDVSLIKKDAKLCYKINPDNTVLSKIYEKEIEVYSQVLDEIYVPKNNTLNDISDIVIKNLEKQVYADKTILKEELLFLKRFLLENKLNDCTLEETIEKLFEEVILECERFFTKYNFLPGMAITTKINDIVVNFNTGYTDYAKKFKICKNTLFDIASISKTPTAILMYKFIEENIFDINSSVCEILPEFKNIPSNLKILDVLMYKGKYITNGRIDEALNIEEANKCINDMRIENLSEYNYNDIVSILCSKILENTSNKSLMNLTKEFIIKPLNLKNVEFNKFINYDKIDNITGTPNKNKGMCNDPKANILGGYAGNAGIFSSSLDMITIIENLLKGNLFKNRLSDFYTKSPLKESRGIAGQSIVPTKIEKKGYFSNLSPIMSLGEDGSTRTIVTSGKYVLNKENYFVSEAIFTNPCSSNPDIIKYYEKKNEKKKGTYYKHFENIGCDRIDIREILPSSSLDEILFSLQKFNLRISLLCSYIKSYEKNYQLKKTIDISSRKR